jgi:hypothetical protein
VVLQPSFAGWLLLKRPSTAAERLKLEAKYNVSYTWCPVVTFSSDGLRQILDSVTIMCIFLYGEFAVNWRLWCGVGQMMPGAGADPSTSFSAGVFLAVFAGAVCALAKVVACMLHLIVVCKGFSQIMSKAWMVMGIVVVDVKE